jgi:hypothetical protein
VFVGLDFNCNEEGQLWHCDRLGKTKRISGEQLPIIGAFLSRNRDGLKRAWWEG